jgi:hypothetical protein
VSTTTESAPANRTWKIALVVAIVLGPSLGVLGSAWAQQTFPDVPPNHTFFEEIEWGAAHGIINGFNNGTFRPNDPVTRGASAAFLSHYNDAIHTVTSTTDPGENNTFFHSTPCPAGERAIGGAGQTSATNLFITDITMSNTYGVRWESDNNSAVNPSSLRVTAVCAPDSVANPMANTGKPSIDKDR